ncbi:MAG: ABC transporter permease [Bacillota bacterium]|nr:ABC transporter permease [Bacillota bacterium]
MNDSDQRQPSAILRRAAPLAPSMLVCRRFIRNRLAIAGALIIAAMLLFSFAGGWISPYGEAEVFTEYVEQTKDIAMLSVKHELRFSEAEAGAFGAAQRAAFMAALRDQAAQFSAGGYDYFIEQPGEGVYLISGLSRLASYQRGMVKAESGFSADAGFSAAFSAAARQRLPVFNIDGEQYRLLYRQRVIYACRLQPLAVASYQHFEPLAAKAEGDFPLLLQAQLALAKLRDAGDSAVLYAEGAELRLVRDGAGAMIYDGQGQAYAALIPYSISALDGTRLGGEFKTAAYQAALRDQRSFSLAGVEYRLLREGDNWRIQSEQSIQVVRDYDAPSGEHWLGTDGQGMDILTRLMYGGRVSLSIGLAVVLLEALLGMLIGGLAGYFGRWADGLLMRIVDVFNCLPVLPLIIIIGALMDGMRVPPATRLLYLMLVLALLGWPPVARLVRGQILSLREQEFMLAAEAAGLSSRRRIFRHLLPNVAPQLIVVCTMGLGEVILTESVLSFLGLGVKFPFASWGNIINSVTNLYVMTNYWFVWMPAGLLILLTVLGFNFIGDGLRDAFDPRGRR